jgi:HEPN domain-containing protein
VAAFRRLAGEELDAAKLLADKHGSQAAYFLQQSVEKLVRGLLEVSGTPAGPTHQILQLARMLDPENVFVGRFVDLDELSAASTRYRYPSPSGEVKAMSSIRLGVLIDKVQALHDEVGVVLDDFARGA